MISAKWLGSLVAAGAVSLMALSNASAGQDPAAKSSSTQAGAPANKASTAAKPTRKASTARKPATHSTKASTSKSASSKPVHHTSTPGASKTGNASGGSTVAAKKGNPPAQHTSPTNAQTKQAPAHTADGATK